MHQIAPHGTSSISRMHFSQARAVRLLLPRGSPTASLATVISRTALHRSVLYDHLPIQVPVNAFFRNLAATTRPSLFQSSQRVGDRTASCVRHTPVRIRTPSASMASSATETKMESSAAKQTASRTSVLVQNEEWEAYPKSSAEFLASFPRGTLNF